MGILNPYEIYDTELFLKFYFVSGGRQDELWEGPWDGRLVDKSSWVQDS